MQQINSIFTNKFNKFNIIQYHRWTLMLRIYSQLFLESHKSIGRQTKIPHKSVIISDMEGSRTVWVFCMVLRKTRVSIRYFFLFMFIFQNSMDTFERKCANPPVRRSFPITALLARNSRFAVV